MRSTKRRNAESKKIHLTELRHLIVVTGHFERPKVRKAADKVKKVLNGLNAEFSASNVKAKKLNSSKTKLVVVIGGDGTLLRVVRELKKAKPVLGIAAGERSALMQVKPKLIEKALEKLVKGTFSIQKRLRLQAKADGKTLATALNEVMLVNKKSGEIIGYCLNLNNKKKYCWKADACIVATPTGSTGHSYSAGSKKLAIGSHKIAIVPSNALNREQKPVYTKGNTAIALTGFDSTKQYEAVIDGRIRHKVKAKLTIKQGPNALFIRL